MKIADWIHEEGDGLPLKIMRAYFGMMTTWQMLVLAPQARRWFAVDGWIFSDCAKMSWNVLSSGFAHGSVILVTGLAGLAMAAGFYARTANVVAWMGWALIGFHFEAATGGGDLIVTYAVFLLMFSRTDKPVVPLWPQKMIFLTLSLFYFSAVLHKLGDSCWRDGMAVYYALQYKTFQHWPVPALLRFPQTSPLLTYSTLVIEGAMAFLPFLMRWKYPILISGVLLHLGISWCLFIPFFGPAMIGLYISALRGGEIRRAWRRLCGNPG